MNGMPFERAKRGMGGEIGGERTVVRTREGPSQRRKRTRRARDWESEPKSAHAEASIRAKTRSQRETAVPALGVTARTERY